MASNEKLLPFELVAGEPCRAIKFVIGGVDGVYVEYTPTSTL